MPNQGTLSGFEEAARIIAVYGIYALTVIAIYYMERRAHANLKDSQKQDHLYFRGVHLAVIVLGVAMIGICTWYWISVNPPTGPVFIRGSVVGLRDQKSPPRAEDDPPLVVEDIASNSPDVTFFTSRITTPADYGSGTCNLVWILEPREKNAVVTFKIQQQFQELKKASAAAYPSGIAPPAGPSGPVIAKSFDLPLATVQKVGGRVNLVYQAAGKGGGIGALFIKDAAGNLNPVPLRDDRAAIVPAEPRTNASLWRTMFPTLLAIGDPQRGQRVTIAPDGSYDEQFGRAMVVRLGSPDLATQLNARRLLVDARERAWPFIRNTLDNPPSRAVEAQLVLANLSQATDELEAAKVPAPGDVHLRLAMAYYKAQDYKTAARYFETAGDGPITDDTTRFYRAYAYSEAGQAEKANRDYQRYLSTASTGQGKAVALANMGLNYSEMKRDDLAESSYVAALKADPTNATACNNLAYLYAGHPARLKEALALANRALAARPNEALFKDTKGWILFKMGSAREGLALIEEAAKAEPGNAEIQAHLAEVRRALGPARAAKK